MTTVPPWVLNEHVVAITRPQPPAIVVVTLPQPPPITVAWPRGRVVQDQPPPAPRVVRLAAPPQRTVRQPLAPVVQAMLASPLPPRRR